MSAPAHAHHDDHHAPAKAATKLNYTHKGHLIHKVGFDTFKELQAFALKELKLLLKEDAKHNIVEDKGANDNHKENKPAKAPEAHHDHGHENKHEH